MLLRLLATVAGWCSNSNATPAPLPPPAKAPAAVVPPPPTSASAIVAETVSGSHALVTIKGYSRTKRLGNGEAISSSAFTLGGCRWSIHYFPDGRGARNACWISIYLHLDHSHGIDAHAKFRFSLLNGHGKPVLVYVHGRDGIQRFMCNGVPWGCQRFISRHALEQSPYLKDDCFRIRCDVTVYGEIRGEHDAATAERLVAVPPPDMHLHLGRLLAGGEGADVTFEVAGETVAAHSYILAARSPVFMAQLFGPMKEKNMACVRIEDMEARVFRALLHFIYTDSLPEMDHKHDNNDNEEDADGDKIALVQHLLVAADRYGLDRLKLLSEHKLCSSIDTSNVGTVLALAERHGCNGLKKACFKFLMSGNNLKVAVATDGFFQHLGDRCPCSSILRELLASSLTSSSSSLSLKD